MKIAWLTTPALFSFTAVTARPWYADRIPNGRSVPHPGPQGGVWAGVGHENAAGGGPRNPFGQDFAAAGFEWTDDLCRRDSDMDGRTNGQELGDPDCVWVPGDEPDGPARSHPGITDTPRPPPLSDKDHCDAYVPPSNVESTTVQFSSLNQVAATPRTQYVCEQQRIASPSLSLLRGHRYYHQIQTQMLLDNANVLHHMWVYQCPDGTVSSDGNKVGQGSYACTGMEGNCHIVAGWAVGAQEQSCEPPNVGSWIDFGPWYTGGGVFKIEAHYDNTVGAPQTDQSGMRLSLTPTPRPLDSGLAIIGMSYWDREFVLPANTQRTSVTNLCPSVATNLLEHPIWVYAWNPHMHLYGKGLVTEHYRCGQKIGELGRIEDFGFNNQQSYTFDKPIKILPGDALVTTCTFDTRGAPQDVVLAGESTTEEMCDNYLTYYPNAGTDDEPSLFTACWTMNQGADPRFVGYDDRTPFGLFDLAGNVVIDNWESDPTQNLADCCATNSCEQDYRSGVGFACAEDNDCLAPAHCRNGLCAL